MRTKPDAFACVSCFPSSSRPRSFTDRKESSARRCKTVTPEVTRAEPPSQAFAAAFVLVTAAITSSATFFGTGS